MIVRLIKLQEDPFPEGTDEIKYDLLKCVDCNTEFRAAVSRDNDAPEMKDLLEGKDVEVKGECPFCGHNKKE